MIVIDPGHGGSDPGATFKESQEKLFNLKIALRVRDYLEKTYTVKIIMTRTSDKALSLKERTDLANSTAPNFYLSIHSNAGGGSGFESYIFNGHVPEQTKTYQEVIHEAIMNQVKVKYDITDRGKKRANFHVLRETKSPALLLEVLFVDNLKDHAFLNQSSFIEDVSIDIAEAIAKALDLPVKPQPKIFYKVIAGSLKNRTNAEERVSYLESKGIEAFIDPILILGEQHYRVLAGAFSSRENAKERVNALKRSGITDVYIVTEKPKSAPSQLPSKPEDKFTIRGETSLTDQQMDFFVQMVNPNAPLLGALYQRFGEIFGVRADVAFAQAVHETNYFRFTGIIRKEQNNFAGIGAAGEENPGAAFKTAEEGVLAHIQHLFAYASTEKIPEGYLLADPLFCLVDRGSAVAWTQLNGKWAFPGTLYGQTILSIYTKMVNFTIQPLVEQKLKLEQILKAM
ncbi:N-acetylmuramoyl-L-alanine amidase [Fictibacillus sp. NRS-1165]|uniref:N-acetylmuramoyl-L-alanine amidase n=1 Tax=Fictibacillus sp. NRS-1165 TaxID=3144463 RepID=UPI003D1F9936